MTQFAFIFPGQGSQSIGMLQDHLDDPIIKLTLDSASDTLGYNLIKLITSGDPAELNKTERTQPAILATSVALYRLWISRGGKLPSYFAGHSLGEYSAFVCAGSLAYEDALALVAERGRLMQEAVPANMGAMAAIIGLDNDRLAELCTQASEGDVVSPANFNAIGQTVIAGSAKAVERVIALATPEAKMIVKLPVSVPSHCDLMRPAAEKLADVLTQIEFKLPAIPVVHNVNASISSSIDEIKNALISQLYSPVKWVDSIEFLIAKGVSSFIECGPGRVLTGLNKRINRQCFADSLETKSQFETIIASNS